MISSVLSIVRRHPIITFFVLSYAISWAFLPIESVRFLPSGPLLAALIVIPIIVPVFLVCPRCAAGAPMPCVFDTNAGGFGCVRVGTGDAQIT